MGGTTEVQVPGPSPEETQNLQMQNQMLQRQMEEMSSERTRQNQLAPLLYQSAGITPKMDASGNIIGFERAPLTAGQQAMERISTLAGQRAEQALAGNLPVSPWVTQDLAKQEQTMGEALRKQLGPGWETSTPGIETLAKFGQSKNAILDAARRGDISQYEAMALTTQGFQNQQMQQLFSNTAGIPQLGMAGAGSFGQVAQGFNSPLNYYQNQRQQQLQAAIANSQKSNPLGSILGGIGGMGLGSFMGSFGGKAGTALGASVFGPSAAAGAGTMGDILATAGPIALGGFL